MANSIRDYLEKGRAGKQFDVEKNMWIDPQTGQAFIPTFTNIQGSDIGQNVKPYTGGTHQMGEPTIDPQTGQPVQEVAQYAGGDPNVPIEKRPAHMIAPEEGFFMGSGGQVRQRPDAMPRNQMPDPNNPAQMASHVLKTMVQNDEIKMSMGLPRGYKFKPGKDGQMTKLEHAYRSTVSNMLRVLTDHYATKNRMQHKATKETFKKSGLTDAQLLKEIRERSTDRLGRPTKKTPQEIIMEIKKDLDMLHGQTGDRQITAGGPQQGGGPMSGIPGLDQPGGVPYKGQPKVVGQIRIKSSGQMIDVREDGTAIINGQVKQVPENIMKTLIGDQPKPRSTGSIDPWQPAGTDAGDVAMSVGAGQPTSSLTIDKFDEGQRIMKDMGQYYK
jgi:hypothetical protein